MKHFKDYLKEHWIWLAIIVILCLFNLKDILFLEQIPYRDNIGAYYPKTEILRQSIYEFRDFFPLWEPYLMSGNPFLDGVAPSIISYPGLFLLLLNDSLKATIFTFIFSILMCGITMYVLAFHLIKDKKSAFLAAIIYAFSGFMHVKLAEGSLNQISAASILPLIMLFLIKAFEKDWLKNSIITGMFVALQILIAPDLKVTLFTSLIVSSYLAIQLIGNNLKTNIKKVFSVSIIILIVILGLTAITILPTKEYIDSGSRAGLTFEESASRKTEFKHLFLSMVEGGIFEYHYDLSKAPGRIDKYKIGIVGFLLTIFGAWQLRNKKIIWFLILTTIVTVLIVTGSSFYYFLWKFIPPWGSFRYLERGYIMWSFAGALLAGFGLRELMSRLKHNKTIVNVTFIATISLTLVSLLVIIPQPYHGTLCDFYSIKDNNQGMDFIESQKGSFRIQNYETNGIDWPIDQYTVPKKIEHIFGYINNWDPDYMNVYLAYSQQDRAKFWGILNVKYITSRDKLNITGLSLIKEFTEFKAIGDYCPPKENLKAFPTYIYQNEQFMPRVWITDNAIAVFGDKNSITQLTYSLMPSNLFDPKNTVLVWKEGKIQDYSLEELSSYNAIILTQGSIDQESQNILSQYKQMGGKILPDILEGKQQITEQEIIQIMQGSYTEIADENIKILSFEEKTVSASKQGWLIMSERYSTYPGWIAKQNNNKLNIERANGIISAVKVNQGEISFKYSPKSFFYGKTITIIAIIGIIIFFIFDHRKRKQ